MVSSSAPRIALAGTAGGELLLDPAPFFRRKVCNGTVRCMISVAILAPVKIDKDLLVVWCLIEHPLIQRAWNLEGCFVEPEVSNCETKHDRSAGSLMAALITRGQPLGAVPIRYAKRSQSMIALIWWNYGTCTYWVKKCRLGKRQRSFHNQTQKSCNALAQR
jgi:hypothetical protein